MLTANDITYVGAFENDKKHGPAKYLYPSGKDRTGIWENNKLKKWMDKEAIKEFMNAQKDLN